MRFRVDGITHKDVVIEEVIVDGRVDKEIILNTWRMGSLFMDTNGLWGGADLRDESEVIESWKKKNLTSNLFDLEEDDRFITYKYRTYIGYLDVNTLEELMAFIDDEGTVAIEGRTIYDIGQFQEDL